ncbi:MAG: cytochrome C biogenesis protein [Armatimonadetes bacterium CG2_30_59_28]|nr:sulfite exporter TauE/SafE family protein [Armatimonadota bacterium]OIO98256.1 MAG: cytochrome C biogenesis protein [Armatimonadetes bacterium CG2_30_59_28]PIU62997.1 MAG: cytochrome C biogenesis protein [Armatimonadetes bacterium CG07_land_8_20_14_0_80_59_28]PIX40429.1 MAG: cytochrome C biogenesis protein [Armatimonadetes bacterium CG_4_8_14_3_um_filter_58_9]PIY45237.1 MAG: cytochrome C biogenesis protein [Armatimonadetes bacterium CG_4_10_14_3_um_filter_59_10]
MDALPVVSALWLGILTSIGPCPLASNIVAISFLARDVTQPRRVLIAGGLYTLGRAAAYTGLAAVIVAGLLSIPGASGFLQKYFNKLLGPVLIVAGALLLDLISLPTYSSGLGERIQSRAEQWGLAAAGILGFVFALSFCPVSAALFFGSLIPLSVKQQPHLLYPIIYGVGTALPVVIIAGALAVGVRAVGEWIQKIGKVESVVRAVTGVAFVVIGIYFVLAHIFEVL